MLVLLQRTAILEPTDRLEQGLRASFQGSFKCFLDYRGLRLSLFCICKLLFQRAYLVELLLVACLKRILNRVCVVH